LRASRRQIAYRETPMTETNATLIVEPCASRIWSAVRKAIRHLIEGTLRWKFSTALPNS
jgi:hypothetical protein